MHFKSFFKTTLVVMGLLTPCLQSCAEPKTVEELKGSYKENVPLPVQTSRAIGSVFKTVLKDIDDFRGDHEGRSITLDKIRTEAAAGQYLQKLFGFISMPQGFMNKGFVEGYALCFPSLQNEFSFLFKGQGEGLKAIIMASLQGRLVPNQVDDLKTVMNNLHQLFGLTKQNFDGVTAESLWIKGASTDVMRANYLGLGLQNNLIRATSWMQSAVAAVNSLPQDQHLAGAVKIYSGESFLHLLEDFRDMTTLIMKNGHALYVNDQKTFISTMQIMAGYLKVLLDFKAYLAEGPAYEERYKKLDFKPRQHLISPRILKGIATRFWSDKAEDDAEFETLYARIVNDADAKAAFITQTSAKLRDALRQIGRFVSVKDIENAKAYTEKVKAKTAGMQSQISDGNVEAAKAVAASGDDLVKISTHLEEAANVVAAGQRMASYRDYYQTNRSLVFSLKDLAKWAHLFGNIDDAVSKYEAMATAFITDPAGYAAAYAVEENGFLSFDPQDFNSTYLLQEVPLVLSQIATFYGRIAEGLQTPA